VINRYIFITFIKGPNLNFRIMILKISSGEPLEDTYLTGKIT